MESSRGQVNTAAVSMTSSLSHHHQIGSLSLETSPNHIVSRALSCIQQGGGMPTESSIEIRNALDAVIRLFLEEYRNRSRNDDIPQLDLRFAKISSTLLLDCYARVYGGTDPPNKWFYEFLHEHAKGLSELIDLQNRRQDESEEVIGQGTVIFYERSRYLDIMALLAAMPAPTCVICHESLYYSCITCHHCCVASPLTTETEEANISAARKVKRRRTNKSSAEPPSASPSAEDMGLTQKHHAPAPMPSHEIHSVPDVHVHAPAAEEKREAPSQSPLGPSTAPQQALSPCESAVVSISASGMENTNNPSAETVGGDLSSISSDVSSRSPAILTEAEQNSKTLQRPETREGRPSRRRAAAKPSSDSFDHQPKRQTATASTLRLSRISESQPQPYVEIGSRSEPARQSEVGNVTVCVNCRPRFVCAAQQGSPQENDRPRTCGGILLLSRFSLSQIALLFILLIDKLKVAGGAKCNSGETTQPEVTRLLHLQSQSVTASLMRHIHRFPRLVDLADLCKTLSHRLYKWDDHIACNVFGGDLGGASARRVEATKEATKEVEVSGSSSSEETAHLNQQSSTTSSSSTAESHQATESAVMNTVNESLMDKLSAPGAELLSLLSWAYLCAAGRSVFQRGGDDRRSCSLESSSVAAYKAKATEALHNLLLSPSPPPQTSPTSARKRRQRPSSAASRGEET